MNMDAARAVAPILHGGGITEAAALFGGKPEDWLDLSTGINPCPVPLPEIPAAVWHRLPDRHLVDSAREAAKLYYAASSCLPLPAPGTQAVIQHLPRLADPSRPVAVVSPTYGEYARVLQAAGLAVELVPDLSSIRPADHGLAVVVNPNNPTGQTHARADLLTLAEQLARHGGRLHVDEAFGDSDPEGSPSADAGRVPGLTVFRSFGKFFGLAGMRLGFVLAEDAVLERFANWLGPWPVSGPALHIAAQLMGQDLTPVHEALSQRHAGLNATLDAAGLRRIGGTSLFTLVEHEAAGALHSHLCRQRILVRKFDYNPRWLRFGLTAGEEADRRLSQALADFPA